MSVVHGCIFLLLFILLHISFCWFTFYLIWCLGLYFSCVICFHGRVWPLFSFNASLVIGWVLLILSCLVYCFSSCYFFLFIFLILFKNDFVFFFFCLKKSKLWLLKVRRVGSWLGFGPSWNHTQACPISHYLYLFLTWSLWAVLRERSVGLAFIRPPQS